MAGQLNILDALILIAQDASGERVVIDQSPFSVGRRSANDLTLMRSDVSGLHAQFMYDGRVWSIVDGQSTNGTYVNGNRVTTPTELKPGDLIHLGNNGFLATFQEEAENKFVDTVVVSSSSDTIQSAVDLMSVIAKNRVYPHFQPIVDLASRKNIGWESLGRAITQSNDGPGILFALAEKYRKAPDLSDAFCRSAQECATCRHCWPKSKKEYLFLNMHADEITGPGFDDLMKRLSKAEFTKWYRIVVEIPESLVCNTGQMATWVAKIRKLGMAVAYDDFGKGQSRIPDLLKVPPDFLKLDRDLIEDLGDDRAKLSIVKALVEACTTLKVKTIGEGIETESELQACIDMGIGLGQGFYLCRPKPAYELFTTDTGTLPANCPFVRLKLIGS